MTAKGFGKRTPFGEYPRHHRGGAGVITQQVTEKTGPVVAARTVHDMQELMIISASGIILRTRIDSIPPVGRSTQGVHLMGVSPGDSVASISVFDVGQVSGKTPQRGAKKTPVAAKKGSGKTPAKATTAQKGDKKLPAKATMAEKGDKKPPTKTTPGRGKKQP